MEYSYRQLSKGIIDRLKTIVGAENVITTSEELEKYSCDETCRPQPHLPDVVVKPRRTSEISELLKLASENRIPVTPRGGGTGLCGGCVPLFGGIVLSLEKMNRIIEIDRDNFTATVEPGVLLQDFLSAVEEAGLYYPLFPGEKTATIGGNVATNAGGMKAIRYGVTRNFVLGLEAVLPDGSIITTGGKFVKSSSGYDLTQLIIGSEGTLAVVTAITLRLTVKPVYREIMLIPFNDLNKAIEVVPKILESRITPMCIEFYDKEVAKVVESYIERKIPYSDHEASLLIIVEADDEEEVYQVSRQVESICQLYGALDTFVPATEKAKKQILEAREKFYPAIKRCGMVEMADVVVPRNKIPEFVETVKMISRKYGIPIMTYGHAGDGNVHVQPCATGMTPAQWSELVALIFKEIYDVGIKLGGVISGEHGIGMDKKAYFRDTTQPEKLELMKRIKLSFDPGNILNPGKIFDI